jgi:hypothetical protein
MEHSRVENGANRRVIHATCSVHRGPVGFANLLVSKVCRQVELDPHVDGSCVITLDEQGPQSSDALTEWLG